MGLDTVRPAFTLAYSMGLGRRRKWQPTSVLLPGESHGPRILVGCSPCGRKELDTSGQLHFDFSLLCVGEGNGSPLQCSCLENPRDGGTWWAAVLAAAAADSLLLACSLSLSPFFSPLGFSRKLATWKPERGLTRMQSCLHFDLRLQASKSVRNQCLLLKPLSL